MKTATDLREIKKLARMFVMLDIQNTEYSPLIVKHPFTDSGMVAYRTEDGGIAQADITSDPAALEGGHSLYRMGGYEKRLQDRRYDRSHRPASNAP